jgi:hypothetical protein
MVQKAAPLGSVGGANDILNLESVIATGASLDPGGPRWHVIYLGRVANVLQSN